MAVGYGGVFNANYFSSTTTATITATLRLGAYLVVTAATDTAASPMSISDSAGGSWTARGNNGGAPYTYDWFRTTKGTGGSFTVTVTSSSSTNILIVGTFYTGSNGTNPTSSAGQYSPSVLASATSPTAPNAGDLIFASGSTIGSPYLTGAGSGFTLNYNGIVAGMQIMHQSRVVLNSESVTAQFAASSITGNTVNTFLIIGTPPTVFGGWGIPLK